MLGIAKTYQGGGWQHNLAATPVVELGTQMTADATIHTKGAWVEVIASTNYDVFGFWALFNTTGSSAAATDVLMDIAIGPSQENIIVPDFMAGWMAGGSNGFSSPVFFPIYIPRGTKISARIQALITADTASLALMLCSGNSGLPIPLFAGCDAYGVASASSSGVAHTPGNSGAESTAANIGSVTSKNYGAVLLRTAGNDNNMVAAAYHWELMIGGVTAAEWYTSNLAVEMIYTFPPCPIPVSIPAGTQLQIRAECSTTAESNDVALYCFY
jgi:hypothetical protein